MNLIDFILMLIFFCAIGLYAYRLHKKRKKARPETARTDTPQSLQAETSDAQATQLLAQALRGYPYPVGNMALNPSLTGTAGADFCKFVSFHLENVPDGLPFGEPYDSTEFDKSLKALGFEISEELKALNQNGYTVLSVMPTCIYRDILVICITTHKASI